MISLRTDFLKVCRCLALALLSSASLANCYAQQPKPAESKPAPTEKNPAQIELLETKYRFETSGDSRKEVHARVRINNELGVRQFARLNFDFNRSFQSVEIPLVRITHASGGIADILPSAITDNPNPAVVDFPAYHDVRVKSVRILGLEPGDLLEYRVITTTTHHPLAPDFWLDHTFDRSGVVSFENYEIDVPENSHAILQTSNAIPAEARATSREDSGARTRYSWKKIHLVASNDSDSSGPSRPDIALSTFASWKSLGEKILGLWLKDGPSEMSQKKAVELCNDSSTNNSRMASLYDFVATRIKTVDLSLSETGFVSRGPDEILSSGYGTAFEKVRLLESMSISALSNVYPAFLGEPKFEDLPPIPSLLTNTIAAAFVRNDPTTLADGTIQAFGSHNGTVIWIDPAIEVAPFSVIRPTLRDRTALFPSMFPGETRVPDLPWMDVPGNLPRASVQAVNVDAVLKSSGELVAKVHYKLSGDNELLLRVAFHKTEKEKWKNVAQMLALSDGFRGQITNVTASDPYATHEPFQVEYEISQPKFADWSKKTVRIPALLPLPGLPEAEPASAGSAKKKSINLGTPLDIDLEATVQLPKGTTAQVATGTSVERDYATFSSKYSVEGNTLHATRKLHFILREIPAARAADWNAFLHAVQSDQTQLFTIQLPVQK